MAVYLPFLLPVSLSLPSALYFFNCVFFQDRRQRCEMGWGCHTYSFTISHFLSSPSLGEHHLSESVTPIWVEHAEVSHCQAAEPLHPTRPSLSLLCSVPLCPSTLANRGNYALNWHPVYTLNRHQLQLCDTRTNTSMLTLPLHFPRSLSATHPANRK